ncbi:MAG: HAMP domain-containing histidine kinase [Ruminococcaceae bacterium]|nr:HAMP domain-containing histidine kinase [Oscillospiraceae bacterium]
MKSIFWRYLTATVALLMLSFSLFSTAFLWLSYNYSLDHARTQLETDAANAAALTSLYLEKAHDPIMQQLYYRTLPLMVENDSSIIIANPNGLLLFYADAESIRLGSFETVDSTAVSETISKGVYFGVGNFGGTYDLPHYTYGIPVVNAFGAVSCIIFTSMPAADTLTQMEDLQRVLLSTGVLILVLSIVVSYFIAQSISKPIKRMIKATSSYAKGDFSVKVPEGRDDEIGNLASAINKMATSLDKLDELRSTFIANVSHELKTPMTTITGFVDGILDGTIPPERQEEYLRRISADTRRLSRLVVRMLQASRIESGQVQIHPMRFNFCETVRQTILGFEQVLQEKNINVEIEFEQDDMYVMADQDNIIQVVFNLTDNACKFIKPHGNLAISVSRSGNKLITTIANTGDTIPAERIPFLFDRFYKADESRGKDKNGAGLGLFIVKSILSMHGEDIHVESENDLTKFTFTLPAVD